MANTTTAIPAPATEVPALDYEELPTTGVRRAVEPTFERERRWTRWGGVIGGLLMAIAAQLLLGLLGHAITLSEAWIVGMPGAKVGLVFVIAWYAAEVLLTSFFGGFMSARLGGTMVRRDGAMSGALTWALGIALALGVSGALGIGGAELGAPAPFMTPPTGMPAAEALFAWSLFGLALSSLVMAVFGGAAGTAVLPVPPRPREPEVVTKK